MIFPPSEPVSSSTSKAMDRRHRDRRTRPGRRRPDGLRATAELPRVLLIEPHEDTRLLYAYMLEESGYAVHSVADGIAGIRAAQRRLPDVVIMEVAVPGADGFAILRQLRDDASTANIPAIVVTSMLHFDVPARARASGAVTVLAKPTELEQLLAVVDEVLMTTPQDRLVARRLRRPLLALRELAKRLAPDASAQERLRALIDRLQVAVLAIDEQGRYVAASPGASALVGYSRAELLTMSIFDAALSKDLPIASRWQSVLRDHLPSADATIRDWGTSRMTVQTSFEKILPGLHVAAFSTSAPEGHVSR